jgi:hypothetical protein
VGAAPRAVNPLTLRQQAICGVIDPRLRIADQ